MELRTPDAVVTIDPATGGRIAQVTIGGRPCLFDDPAAGPLGWGCYPMVPWAGRTAHAEFPWDGETVRLEALMPPHAIHGTGFVQPWDVIDVIDVIGGDDGAPGAASSVAELACALDWPLGGVARQRITLTPGQLRCELSVTAAERSMPVSLGWHPWFRRPAGLDVDFAAMYQRGPDGLPTGSMVPVPPGPWDDCFVFPGHDPQVRLDGVTITLSSDCTHWVVYDERDYAVCVEPQSAPPNAVHLGVADVLAPGATFSRWMTWRWPVPVGVVAG